MPQTVRETVLDGVEAVLAGIPGYQVLRLPSYAIGADDMPALILIDGGDDVTDRLTAELSLELRFAVVCAVTGDDGHELARNASQARGQVLAALGADPTLNGLVELVRYLGSDDPAVSNDPGETPYAAYALQWAVEYGEAEGNPYRPAP